MARASAVTPSVSRKFILVETGKEGDIGKAMEQDRGGNGSRGED